MLMTCDRLFAVFKPSDSKNLGISSEVSTGVANAARTRDLLNHNQMLYQLSYGHHSAVFSKLNSRNR